ncbi:MAG: rhodanese-like domain-containing protein [Oscillatoria sp. PMC 1068.18]|nr:rhodanese-like domain-containing protein [Oscillatoria sp. PMC 1076.18]MEC4991406.1 rhodanese-like domain-containing protein [Oscillatoria sp. PMC 1068.18]
MSNSQTPGEITVEELATAIAAADRPVQLIDVREPAEAAIALIDGFVLLPLSEFAEWSETIPTRFDADVETLVICHHGYRSAQMCYWLRSQGFTNVKNIVGGIEAYSVRVDTSIPRY